MPLLPPSGLADFRVTETAIALTAAVKSVAANSPTRIFLSLTMATGAGSVGLSAGVTANTGTLLNTSLPPLEYSWSDAAALVSQQWYAVSGAGGNMVVREVFYEPKSRSLGVERGDTNQQTDTSISAYGKGPQR